MGAKIIIGAFWGDEGKGLISTHISHRDKALMVCRGGTGPNAEHGIFVDGNYVKVNQLPLGWYLNDTCEIGVGSGVAVDPVKLLDEEAKYGLKGRVWIDYRCPIVTAEHIKEESDSKHMKGIGSTFSGTGSCRRDFVSRVANQARSCKELKDYVTDLAVSINEHAEKGTVVVESSQGTFLSLAASFDYPNVTSDNVTTCAVADDVLLNWKNIQDVILVVKALPTREGAGSLWSDEFMENEIIQKGLVEQSSIGGVTRRKAKSMNMNLLEYACMLNGATQIALTFCDHFDHEVTNVKEKDKITTKIWKLIEEVETRTNVPVTLLNTGKEYNNIVEVK
jgi:adenylosuccinate synthase